MQGDSQKRFLKFVTIFVFVIIELGSRRVVHFGDEEPDQGIEQHIPC